jgi:hypothetical protein
MMPDVPEILMLNLIHKISLDDTKARACLPLRRQIMGFKAS